MLFHPQYGSVMKCEKKERLRVTIISLPEENCFINLASCSKEKVVVALTWDVGHGLLGLSFSS